MLKKNKKDLSKFDSILKKEIIVIDKNEFEDNVSKVTKEIISTLRNEYGIEIPSSFENVMSRKFENVIVDMSLYGNGGKMLINDIISLPYHKFAGKIDIETPEDFEMISKTLELASEIKK